MSFLFAKIKPFFLLLSFLFFFVICYQLFCAAGLARRLWPRASPVGYGREWNSKRCPKALPPSPPRRGSSQFGRMDSRHIPQNKNLWISSIPKIFVPRVGLEPTRRKLQTILSRSCKPIPAPRQNQYFNKFLTSFLTKD